MEQAAFWSLIEAARVESIEETGDYDAVDHAERIVAQLKKLGPDGLLAFGEHFSAAMNQANTAELWAASWIIAPGDQEVGPDPQLFAPFRAWLIAQGSEVFEAAIDDPETLADLEDDCFDGCYSDALLMAAETAFISLAPKQSVPDVLSEFDGPEEFESSVDWLDDDSVVDDDQLVEQFPTLIDRFGVPGE